MLYRKVRQNEPAAPIVHRASTGRDLAIDQHRPFAGSGVHDGGDDHRAVGFDPLRADAEALPPALSEPLLVFVDAQGQILVSGQAQSETEIEQKLQALKQSAGRVEVRADAAAPAGRIFFLLTAAEKAALSDLKIVTLGRTR